MSETKLTDPHEWSNRKVKQAAVKWLSSEQRTNEDIAEKMLEIMNGAIDRAINGYQLEMKKDLFKALTKPIPQYNPGPWWKIW